MFMLANRHIGKFIAQELANTTCALGTATRSDAVLFAALARAMERCLGAFSAQNLANTAWASGRQCSRMRCCSRRWRGLCSDAWAHSSRRLSPTQRGRSGRQRSQMRCGVGEGGGATPGCIHRAGSRQHSVGVRDGNPVGCGKTHKTKRQTATTTKKRHEKGTTKEQTMSNPSINRDEKKAIAHKHANKHESATKDQLSI